MKAKRTKYTHGATAGKNLKLLFAAVGASVLHTLLWGGLLLTFTVSVWYAALSAGALGLLAVLRFLAGKSA